uniref:Uncharacterized protein n=1 Tax=Eutreptiella gymnastica TaxID=73025 RepID=A0A7S1N0E5_9EUGL|mmetsp:Transcript_100106/g.172798  ORF Transcript_100106/g.172798 Transcript_100106/m.172798 type:complete len:418 (+) Transcript_100106:70-1323(+)
MYGGSKQSPLKPLQVNTSLSPLVPNSSLGGVPKQRLNALEPLSIAKENDGKRTKTIPTELGAPFNAMNKSRREEMPRANLLALRHVGAQPLVKKSLPLQVDGQCVTHPQVCSYRQSVFGKQRILMQKVDSMRKKPTAVRPLDWNVDHVVVDDLRQFQSWAQKHNVGPLFAAAVGSDAKATKVLLQLGADPEEQDLFDGSRPIHIAALKGASEVVTSLLDAQAQVSAARTKDGATGLHLAAAHKHPHIVELLLDKKASPNLVAQDGCTALMLAARVGDAASVGLLVNAKADCMLQATNGATALHWAAQKGSFDVVEHLIRAGADPKVADNKARTPLHYAARKGRNDVIPLLIRAGACIDAHDYRRQTARQVAVRQGHKLTERLLIQLGARELLPATDGDWVSLDLDLNAPHPTPPSSP